MPHTLAYWTNRMCRFMYSCVYLFSVGSRFKY
uniref:Uncharacterized protein n=1 Tax=Rhizophora mucronata TaxID=61149 RepID=A0A2P2PTP2_RHIMU